VGTWYRYRTVLQRNIESGYRYPIVTKRILNQDFVIWINPQDFSRKYKKVTKKLRHESLQGKLFGPNYIPVVFAKKINPREENLSPILMVVVPCSGGSSGKASPCKASSPDPYPCTGLSWKRQKA
jgi:hypothetical protein